MAMSSYRVAGDPRYMCKGANGGGKGGGKNRRGLSATEGGMDESLVRALS